MTKEVAKKQETALAPIDFTADAGAGFEEADQQSFAIPFLTVLQSGSPQCKKSDGAYIKGAEEGMLHNTVSNEIFSGDDGLLVVPCYYRHVYLLWAPGRKGFRGSMTPSEYAACNRRMTTITTPDGKEKQVEVDENNNIISDTREHYVLVVKPDSTYEPAVLSLSSSQIKKSKRWMTMMNNIRINGQIAPMFSQQYKLTTVPESNEQGSWYGIKTEHNSQVADIELYNAAKQFRDMVRSGQAQVQQDTGGEDIPF